MNLREEILKEHSKKQCTNIVHWVGDDQQRFDELFRLFIKDNYRVVQRAAWPLSYCVKANPHFIKSNFGKLILNLQQLKLHNAIKRNTIRLLQWVDIPKKFQGAVMELCFMYLQSPEEPVAVKIFSMSVLKTLSEKYPEIVPELQMVIREQLPRQTAGFRSRANKIGIII